MSSWTAAVSSHAADAAVLAVVTAADRPGAAATAELLTATHPGLLVASGAAFGADLTRDVHTLPNTITAAARHLDEQLSQSSR